MRPKLREVEVSGRSPGLGPAELVSGAVTARLPRRGSTKVNVLEMVVANV